MDGSDVDQRVASVRRFSRFYTRRIGALRDRMLGSELSLPEARIVYELAQRPNMTASELSHELLLDAGYLSRILRRLQQRRVIERNRSEIDRRCSHIALTERGQDLFAKIDTRSSEEVAAMLDKLPNAQQHRLIRAMATVEELLSDRTDLRIPYILRPHRAGDMGWIVHRHGVIYAEEYGWDATFEALVAEIVAGFLRQFDPNRERCWIAERGGEVVGSVMLVADSAEIGKLRLLYVEPAARGFGIGGRLVEECVRFARQAGYAKVTLWTNDVLTAARRLYERAGFRLMREEPHQSFGHDLVGQYWELDLCPDSVSS